MQRRMLYTQEKKKKQIPSCKKNLPSENKEKHDAKAHVIYAGEKEKTNTVM